MPNIELARPNVPLVLHAGAHEASREDIFNTRTPDPTESHVPIPHGALIDLITRDILASGKRIDREAFGLWRDGQRMFGVMQVSNGENPDDYGMLIGVRNSHDKAFAASIALGSLVFVCDNMAFSGEVTLSRSHTRHIMRDLPGLISTGIGKLVDMRGYQDKRIAAYKDQTVADDEAHDLVIRALRKGIINTQRIPKIVGEWHEPTHDDFKPRTVWSLFNAFTEGLKGSGANLQPRTLRLHGLMDDVVGLDAFDKLSKAEAIEVGEGHVVVQGVELGRTEDEVLDAIQEN